LTALAKVFTEARLEQYAGWVHGSKMSRRYVHFSARDIEDAVLELHGMKPPEQADVPKLVQCPRCKENFPLGTVHCKHSRIYRLLPILLHILSNRANFSHFRTEFTVGLKTL
jgi:hypothetical protein